MGKEKFDDWKKSIAPPEENLDPETIAYELEYHVLPVLKVAPSNKALFRAKQIGCEKGRCTQKQLVELLEKSGRFVVESAADYHVELGNDVMEYQALRDRPNVMHNEYVIRQHEDAKSEVPVREIPGTQRPTVPIGRLSDRTRASLE